MLKILITVLVVINSYGYKLKIDNEEVKKVLRDLESLNYKHKKIMKLIYNKCSKHDLANTCLAISYVESHFGDYAINSETGDYGIMGINLKTFINRHKLNVNKYGAIKIATRLVRDDEFNLDASIENLLYWVKVRKKKWRYVWGSYNGGYRPNKRYANKILNTIIALRKYFRKHPIERLYIKGS